MGIYDRDYIRPDYSGHLGQRRARSPGAFFRGLTAVQWLVIINIAIFVVDALLGAQQVIVPAHMGTILIENAPADTIVDRSVHMRDPNSGMYFYPVRDAGTGAVVGQWRFSPMTPMAAVGHFSTAKGFVALEVWRMITFQFLHGGVNHLLFNMIALWFFGPLVEQRMGTKQRFLAFYLMCGICGALLYLILNLAGYLIGTSAPLLLINDVFTPLIGASAGVFGVLMASAYIAGDAIMLVFFVLPMRIRTGAYLMFLFALGNLFFGGSNAGGDAAHVGGAIAGFFFIRNTHLLKDFFAIGRPAASQKVRSQRAKASTAEADHRKLDDILDKVSREGLHSLSETERTFLRRQTDQRRGGS